MAANTYASDRNIWSVSDALFGQAGIDGHYEINRRAGMDLGRLRAGVVTTRGQVGSKPMNRSIHWG